ncbi:MAG: coenzyme F420-reducing hydrogenase subunit beta [Lentisphaerae bacterium ADurb.Bin242]|nr:MAG: coenzyme F420-reducing hydrogenase subunit beta [Lentisphaerae bacterium ADurb.Bin242]
MSQEGFDKLKKECIDSGLCFECGLCAAVCPPKAIEMKHYEWGNNPELAGKCADGECTKCFRVCAAKDVLFGKTEETFFGRKRDMNTFEKFGGVIRFSATGCATDPEVRHTGVSGGVASAVLIHALEKGIIDGCVLAGWDEKEPWRARAFVARNRKEVLACSGSKYQPHPQLLGIREAYETGLKKIAVTTTPCHAGSLRRMMLEGDFAEYTGIIRLVISSFCAAHWALAGTRWLLKTWLGVEMEDVKELRYRTGTFPGTFRAVTKDGTVHEKAFVRSGGVAALGRFTPEECRVCLEKIGYSADLVFGDTWGHPGNFMSFDMTPPAKELLESDERIREAAAKGLSAILCRSGFATKLIDECRRDGCIKVFENTAEETEKFLKHVTSEKTDWYTPWIEARKRRGMPVRNYHL